MAVSELRKLISVAHLMLLLWLRENLNFFILIFSILALFVIGVFDVWLVLAPYVCFTAVVFLTRLYLEDRSEALAFFLNINNVQDIAWFIVKHLLICLLTLPVVFLYQLSDAGVNAVHWVFTIIGCVLTLHLTFGLKNKFAIIIIGSVVLVSIKILLLSTEMTGTPGILLLAAAVLMVLNVIRIKNEYSSFF